MSAMGEFWQMSALHAHNVAKKGWIYHIFSRLMRVMIDTRFSTALQIVISVAVNEEAGRRCTSDTLATSLDTSASFVRKF